MTKEEIIRDADRGARIVAERAQEEQKGDTHPGEIYVTTYIRVYCAILLDLLSNEGLISIN